METWKSIPFTNGEYEASSLGNIRSTFKVIQKSDGTKYTRISKVLKPAIGKDRPGKRTGGYLKVAFSLDSSKLKSYQVSRLVCFAFHGPPTESKYEVNHINGIKTDNRPENLEWCTRSENIKHAFKHGLSKPMVGSRNGHAKLSEQDVLEIREYAANFKGRYYGREALALKYGVTVCTIKEVVNRRRNRFYNV